MSSFSWTSLFWKAHRYLLDPDSSETQLYLHPPDQTGFFTLVEGFFCLFKQELKKSRVTLSSLVLAPGSFPSLGSFFSLVLGGLFLSPPGPRGELLCWAFPAMLSRLLGGLLSLTGWERRRPGRGECLQTRDQLRLLLHSSHTGLLLASVNIPAQKWTFESFVFAHELEMSFMLVVPNQIAALKGDLLWSRNTFPCWTTMQFKGGGGGVSERRGYLRST